MKSLVWLASYPKSGNTWLRVFMANYLLNRPDPVPINDVFQVAFGDSLLGFYAKVAGRPVDPRNEAAVLALRHRVLEAITRNGAPNNLVKTHNLNVRMAGTFLIPADLTRLGVYILRNPLDMALSYADHYGLTADQVAEAIASPSNRVVADANNVMQYLGSWSQHVKSWTEARDFPVLTMRYEDMHADPQGQFSRLIERLGFKVDPERLDRAIRFSSFRELRRQEDQAGFRERTRHAERFFRAGTTGQWRDKLPEAVAERICRDHGPVMKRHGYLP